MNILVVGAVTGVLAAPAAANAIELNCPAPAVLVGDSNPGNDPVVSVHVYRFGDIGAWHVTYRFSSGVTISRGEQYDITTISYGRTSYWTGPLKRDPNIVNLGAIYGPSAVGEYTYRETIRKNGQIIVEMEAGHCVRVDNEQAVTSPSPSISERWTPKQKKIGKSLQAISNKRIISTSGASTTTSLSSRFSLRSRPRLLLRLQSVRA